MTKRRSTVQGNADTHTERAQGHTQLTKTHSQRIMGHSEQYEGRNSCSFSQLDLLGDREKYKDLAAAIHHRVHRCPVQKVFELPIVEGAIYLRTTHERERDS